MLKKKKQIPENIAGTPEAFNNTLCHCLKGKRFYLWVKLLTLAKEKGRPARFVIRFRLQGTGAMLRPLLFLMLYPELV